AGASQRCGPLGSVLKPGVGPWTVLSTQFSPLPTGGAPRTFVGRPPLWSSWQKGVRIVLTPRCDREEYGKHSLIMKCTFGIRGLLVLSTALSLVAGDWPQWRGQQRNGLSPETGLLKEWPKAGPMLRWKVADVGSGYSTPAVV